MLSLDNSKQTLNIASRRSIILWNIKYWLLIILI